MALKKKCPVCGTINDQMAMLCIECGSELHPDDIYDDSAVEKTEQNDNPISAEKQNEAGFQGLNNLDIKRKCECGEICLYSIQNCPKCGQSMSLGQILGTVPSEVRDDKRMAIRSEDGMVKFVLHSGDELILGRDGEFSSYFNDKPYVSGKHAILSLIDGRLRIKHIGNTNPTLVNGKEIKRNQLYILRESDTFSLGAREGQGYVSKAAYFRVFIP